MSLGPQAPAPPSKGLLAAGATLLVLGWILAYGFWTWGWADTDGYVYGFGALCAGSILGYAAGVLGAGGGLQSLRWRIGFSAVTVAGCALIIWICVLKPFFRAMHL